MSRQAPRREAVVGAVCTVVGEHMVLPPISERRLRDLVSCSASRSRARRPPKPGHCKWCFSKDMNVDKVRVGVPV